MPAPLPDLIDVERIHERYGFHPDVIRDWFQTGQLVGFKIGRRWFTTPDGWQQFLDARQEAAG